MFKMNDLQRENDMSGRKTRHLGVVTPKTWALMRLAFSRRLERAEAPIRQHMAVAPWGMGLVEVARADGERVIRAGFTLGRFAVVEALGYPGWWTVVTTGPTWTADQEGRCVTCGRWRACDWAKQIACLLTTCATLPQMQCVVELASEYDEPLAVIGPPWMRELASLENPYEGTFGRLARYVVVAKAHSLGASEESAEIPN